MVLKESDLYPPVKKLLEAKGYDVYAEVTGVPGNWSSRADVVATNYPAVCVVEMKTSLSLELIEQAFSWIPMAHYIYIAIPKRKKKVPVFVKKVLSQYGIGIIEVNTMYSFHASITHPARFNRPKYSTDWKALLKPEHKTWVQGGTNSGGHVTHYKLTIQGVRDFLRRKGKWCTISEILEHCETHYASPKNSLAKALVSFEHEWCEVKVENRKRYYRLKKGVRK